ncbi:MAG TPA: hypothetical protein VGT78_09480 [Rhizomicrobium sp.]|nr:hypothetical protein [Rhizomicrobium sp.]
MTHAEVIPLILPVDLAGAILGINRAAAYAMAKRGDLPVLPGGGRRKVPTAGLERLVGRQLEPADILAAERKLAPEREALRHYGSRYRAARTLLAEKKTANRAPK